MNVRRRLTNGLGFTAAYTWSKAEGDFLDHLSAGGGAVGNFPGSAYAMEQDYGPLAFDIPRRFVTSFIYELPAGRGRHYQPKGVAGALINDWVVNGILNVSDGRPFTVTSNDPSEHRTRPHLPRQLRRRSRAVRFQPDDRWVVRRHRIRSAGAAHLRQLRLEQRARAGIEVDEPRRCSARFRSARAAARAPTRNVQSVQLGELRISRRGTCRTWARFGKITSSLGDPREIQFAVKFYF